MRTRKAADSPLNETATCEWVGVGVKEGLRENNSGAEGVLAIFVFSSVGKE